MPLELPPPPSLSRSARLRRLKRAGPQAMLLSRAPDGFPTISAHMLGLELNVRDMRNAQIVQSSARPGEART
eukprot:2108956-Pyramimonas_sp.AAC.1